jgi:WD40 repeat protein
METVTCVAFSPDGKRIVTGTGNKTVKVWEADTGREFLTLKEPNGVYLLAVSPDGKRIVSRSQDGTLEVWDTGGPD